jgi:signal transduction histidine kinase
MNTPLPAFPTELSEESSALFLHKLRHDLINTVRPMVEIPKWIEEDIVSEGSQISDSMRENLDLLRKSGHRLHQMIEDLMVFAHINQHSETAPPVLSEIITAMTEKTLPDQFKLTTDLTHNTLPIPTPDVHTLFDALLSNCIKHHDRSSGRIHIACKRIERATQLTVSDDGPGIGAKFIDCVFDPLTTLNSRDQVEGSGMGLTIAQRIATMNGGRIKVISAADKRGTCIAI